MLLFYFFYSLFFYCTLLLPLYFLIPFFILLLLPYFCLFIDHVNKFLSFVFRAFVDRSIYLYYISIYRNNAPEKNILWILLNLKVPFSFISELISQISSLLNPFFVLILLLHIHNWPLQPFCQGY